MALAFGKVSFIVGAALAGSVLAKEGGLLDVSSLVSGGLKLVFRQLKQEESTRSATKPHNDTLLAQVNSLRNELQLLASNRPITIVTSSGSGGRKYAIIIVIGVVGYGCVWWKGWKLSDFTFATRRSLSDACNNVGHQIDGFYSSLSGTKRELSSKIDKMGRSLDTNMEVIQETGREVTELRDGTAKMEDNVRSALDAVETLASKVFRIEGNQDITLEGVGALYAQTLENIRVQESNQALPPTSSSSVLALEPGPMTPSSRTSSLPPISPHESQSQPPLTPNGAPKANGSLKHTQSMSGLKDISGSSSSRENGTHSGEATGDSGSGSGLGRFGRFAVPRIVRSISALNRLPPTS